MRLRPKQVVRECLNAVVLVGFPVNSAVRKQLKEPEIDPSAGSEANMACIMGYIGELEN